MTNTKRIPVPLVFSLVLVLVTVLIIFFGAWAVAADVDNQRSLAFGIPGTTATLSGNTVNADSSAPQSDQISGTDNAGDTWWGNALLSTCPLH